MKFIHQAPSKYISYANKTAPWTRTVCKKNPPKTHEKINRLFLSLHVYTVLCTMAVLLWLSSLWRGRG